MPRLNARRHGSHLGTVVLTCVAAGAMAIGGPLLDAQPAAASTKASTIPAGFQDWPMMRHDQLHSGVSSETILSTSTTFKLHWSEQTGDLSFTSPAVVYDPTLGESLVYSGNMDGYFTAYNAATGVLVWSYQTPKVGTLSKEIESSAAVDMANNVLYFGDGDYLEYALNATTGAFICNSPSMSGISASSPVIGDPAGTGNVIYFGDAGPTGSSTPDGGHLWAMYGVGNTAGAACSIDWMFDSFGDPPGSQTGKAGVWSTPAYAQLANGTNVVVVGSSDNDDAIYEFNATTGAALWRFQTLVGTDSDVGAPPAIAEPATIGAAGSQLNTDGAVFDMGKDGIMYALDLQTGAQIWDYDVKTELGSGEPSVSGAALVGNYLYTGYGAGVYSLDAVTGALNWVSPAMPAVISSPSVTGPAGNQIIAVGDQGGNVDVFSLATGAALYTYRTGGVIDSSAAFSTGQLFINSTDGNLYAFGAGVAPSPELTSVDPNQGAAGSSNVVTLTGNAFNGATEVDFGSTVIPSTTAYPCVGSAGGCFDIASPTQILVDTPTSLAAGSYSAQVVTPGGTSVIVPGDTYTLDASSVYTPLATPFRICDTRPGSTTPVCAGKTLGAGSTLDVQITGANVPKGATAVVINLTGINDTSTATYLSAYPAGEPSVVSNINLAGDQVDANLAIVQLSATGQIDLFNSLGRADAVVDVEGYFDAPGTAPIAGEFHTMPPLRICDSRAGMDTECAGAANNPINAGTWHRVVLSGLPPGAAGGTPSIPTTGAEAAVFNLTAVGASQATYLSVTAPNSSDACPTTAPKFSNINSPAGVALPNRVIATLGPNQDICVFNNIGSVNFIIDVNGWFGNGHETAAGAMFYAVPPARICDTRVGSGDRCDGDELSPGGIQPIVVAGVDVVPAEGGSNAPVAVVGNLTAVLGSAATVFTLYPSNLPQPRASDLNPSANQVIANLAVVGIATSGAQDGDVSLFNDLGYINALFDVAGWFQ
jgi:outer membrane protein assembly factor BamB